jgi:hypothetical protein
MLRKFIIERDIPQVGTLERVPLIAEALAALRVTSARIIYSDPNSYAARLLARA